MLLGLDAPAGELKTSAEPERRIGENCQAARLTGSSRGPPRIK
jgi:hypothetical protein